MRGRQAGRQSAVVPSPVLRCWRWRVEFGPTDDTLHILLFNSTQQDSSHCNSIKPSPQQTTEEVLSMAQL